MRRFYGNLRRIRDCPWVDVGIDPYANLGKFQKFRIARKTGIRIRIIPMRTINVTLKPSKHRRNFREALARRGFRPTKIGRPLVPSQQAPGFLWQDSRRGSVSGLNCRRKERHLLQLPLKKRQIQAKNPHSQIHWPHGYTPLLEEIHVRPRFRRRYGTALSRPDLA